MRARLWLLAAGFVLAGIVIVSVPARADISWSGAGWYVEETASDFDFVLISGPYSNKTDCEADKPKDYEDYSYY
ncbi:MAG: hypothetical protein ACRD3W_15915, partial [Terriglobales bacterium]